MMRRQLALTLAFVGALVSSVAFSQVRGASDDTIRVGEIQPGMQGYGLTVFRGFRPERFDVEVIDVLHNFRPDQDLILVRVDHPIINAAHVIGGMSGSPIYFDGRLAGAYAYGWPFSQDPIAGVTPIANMAREMRRPMRPSAFPIRGPEPTPASGASAARRRVTSSTLAGLPPFRGGALVDATSALSLHRERVGPASSSTSTLVPASTPLLVGGFDDAVVRMLDEQLGDFGLTVLQAGGAGQREPAPGTPTRYENGSAVGVQLVRGDIASTAVGTVTQVEGQRLSAFGHPMVNAGQTALPTALARVLHILSSQQRSFKISEPARSIGSLIHDRQAAVVVDSSVHAHVVPVRVRILGVPEAGRTEWNFEVASHRILTPVLINASILNAMRATASDSSDVMFEATTRVTISGRSEPQVVTDRGYSRLGVGNAAALRRLRLFALLEATYGNPFEVARAERIEVDIRLRFARETATILDASVAQPEVDPGSTIGLRVTLRRYDQQEEVRIVPLHIPDRLAGQTVEIYVQAGQVVRIQHGEPRDLDELLAIVHQRYPATSLVASLRTPSRGLRFGGHIVRHLPPSALDTLQLQNDADRGRPFITYDRTEVPVDTVVTGTARVSIQVRARPRSPSRPRRAP